MAKSVIFLFMEGGPSHLDTFDPKPELNRLAGQSLPPSFKPVITPMGEGRAPLMASRRKWKQHGQSGIWVSDWLPHIANCVDDITVIRSCWSNGLNHVGGVCQMNTGSTLAGRPSLGSWVTYGLGSENANLPGFVVMQDFPRSQIAGGPRNWGTGFMPAVYQGTRLDHGTEPFANLKTPAEVGPARQERKLELLGRLNRRHLLAHSDQSELDARIKSYELAFRMQAEAPEAVDLSRESPKHSPSMACTTRQPKPRDDSACWLAAWSSAECDLSKFIVARGSKWDSHADIEGNHAKTCRAMDQPVAGLLMDLKRRGLLGETLVVWGGEFGRTPMSEKGNGRDHNPYGFTMWMAGGGVRPGVVVGSTDDLGLHAIEDRLHVHDIHATILHALGVDHTRLIYRHQGRPERPTVNEGQVFHGLFKA